MIVFILFFYQDIKLYTGRSNNLPVLRVFFSGPGNPYGVPPRRKPLCAVPWTRMDAVVALSLSGAVNEENQPVWGERKPAGRFGPIQPGSVRPRARHVAAPWSVQWRFNGESSADWGVTPPLWPLRLKVVNWYF